MPVTLNELLVITSPAYAAILDLWRRVILEGEQSVDGDELDEVAEEVQDKLEDELEELEEDFDADIARVMAMMDELHEDAQIIHDQVITHNPCHPECPFCDHDK